jgi:hypothetical protein
MPIPLITANDVQATGSQVRARPLVTAINALAGQTVTMRTEDQ